MSEVLLIPISISVILGYLWYEARRQLAHAQSALTECQAALTQARCDTLLSAENLRKTPLAVYWLLKRDQHRETGFYVERDPTGINRDAITERYEREMDDFGRCLREWRHTERRSRGSMRLRADYVYPNSHTKNPCREVYYDERGVKDVWVDALIDDGGVMLGYIRSRRHNSTKDVVLYEYDSAGILRKEYSCEGTPWPYGIEDIPSKFHAFVQTGLCTIFEYDYFEGDEGYFRGFPQTASVPLLKAVKSSRGKKIYEHSDNCVSQIFEEDFEGLRQATHFFPNQDNAVITVMIRRGRPSVEVHVDLTKDHGAAISGFIDTTS